MERNGKESEGDVWILNGSYDYNEEFVETKPPNTKNFRSCCCCSFIIRKWRQQNDGGFAESKILLSLEFSFPSWVLHILWRKVVL